MRLGLWNRLAIVATVLAVMIVPVAIIADINGDQMETQQRNYELCLKWANEAYDHARIETPAQAAAANSKLYAKIAECGTEHMGLSKYRPGWKDWREFVGGTLAGCAIIYALIWLIAWTCRWVWAGRRPNA